MIRKSAPLFLSAVILLSSVAAAAQTRAQTRAQGAREIPREWVDPDTGHRVIRLSDEPGSASLYFHQNAYTPDGQKLVITTPTGLSTINLKTRQIERVVEGRVGVIVVGRKTGQVYYVKYDRETN